MQGCSSRSPSISAEATAPDVTGVLDHKEVERDERTAKIRVASQATPDPDYTPEGGVPVYRTRARGKHREGGHEESGTLARATIEHADQLVRERFGGGLSREIKALLASEVSEQFQSFAKRRSEDNMRRRETYSPAPRSSVAWFVAAVLGLVVFVGALGFTWDRIYSVERAQAANEEYATIVANWLVIDAANSFDRYNNLDKLMRALAAHGGLDVSHIQPPSRTQPPTPVLRKHNDYLLSQGK